MNRVIYHLQKEVKISPTIFYRKQSSTQQALQERTNGLTVAKDRATALITKVHDSKIINTSMFDNLFKMGMKRIDRELCEGRNQPISESTARSIHEIINNPVTSEVELMSVVEDDALVEMRRLEKWHLL